MTDSSAPSKLSVAMTWAVVAITALLLVYGIVRYGLSVDTRPQFWADIAGRLQGPMTFRFFLQPTLAFVAALHDGVKDVRQGHKAFFWTALYDPTQHRGRLQEGLIDTSRLALIGISMDVVYQFRVFDQFHPVEVVVMVLLLAILPYFIFRWIIELVGRWWVSRKSAHI